MFAVQPRNSPDAVEHLARSTPSGPRASKTVCVHLDSRNGLCLSSGQTVGGGASSFDFELSEPVSGVVDLEFAALHFPCDLLPDIHSALGNAHLLFFNPKTQQRQFVRVPDGRYDFRTDLLLAVNDALAASADPSSFPFSAWQFAPFDSADPTSGAKKPLLFRPVSGSGSAAAVADWMIATNARFGGLAGILGFVPRTSATAAVSDTTTDLVGFPLSQLGPAGALPAPSKDPEDFSPSKCIVVHVQDTHHPFGSDPAGAAGANRILLQTEPARSIAIHHFDATPPPPSSASHNNTHHAIALCHIANNIRGAFFADTLGNGTNVACCVRKHYPHPTATNFNAHVVRRLRVTLTNELLLPLPLPPNTHFALTLRLTTYGT